MNKIQQACLTITLTIILAGCAPAQIQATPVYVKASCAGQTPQNCGITRDATVLITFSGDTPVSATPDKVRPCTNGKVTFNSSDGGDFAVILSPGSGDKVKLKQNVWSSNGTMELKMKSNAGCTTYTVLRKTATGGKILDPVIIIDR